MMIQRRQFVKLAVAGSVATQSSATVWSAKQTEIPIIDTHQHLWDLVEFQPPWLKEADPKIAAKHAISDYLAETTGLNVIKAVYMEIDVAPVDQNKEADYVLSLIRTGQSPTVAAVISGRPDAAGFAAYIKRYRDNPLIKGVRQVLHVESAPRGMCLQPQFVKSMQLLGEMNKSFDLCMRPTELADGAALAEQCPDTRFIVDHCGNADPNAWKANTSKSAKPPSHSVEQWQRDIEKLAKCPNVICKISGIVARAPQGWTADFLAPAIDFCLDQFGPNRVVFGGDWPVCKLGASFAEWVKGLKEIISQRPREEQERLFYKNAEQFYGV